MIDCTISHVKCEISYLQKELLLVLDVSYVKIFEKNFERMKNIEKCTLNKWRVKERLLLHYKNRPIWIAETEIKNQDLSWSNGCKWDQDILDTKIGIWNLRKGSFEYCYYLYYIPKIK